MKNPPLLNLKQLPETHDGKDAGFVGVFDGDELAGRVLIAEILTLAKSLGRKQRNDGLAATEKLGELGDEVFALMSSQSLSFEDGLREATRRHPEMWRAYVERVNQR